MSTDILILKHLYSKIHCQCTVKFMEQPTECYSYVFPKIINLCESLLEKCEKGCVEKWSVEPEGSAAPDDLGNINIEEEIKKAYHSVWMKDTLNQDDVYFLSRKQARLLDCNVGDNPYKELKQTAAQYNEKIDLREADVVELFKQIAALLEQEMPLEIFIHRANQSFLKCKEFLFEYKK